MKRFMAAFLPLLLAAGCASQGWQAENVPVPRSTPYDSNQLMRNAYLEGFRQGYRAQYDATLGTVETIPGPYALVRRQGFYAGAAHARAENTGPATATPRLH